MRVLVLGGGPAGLSFACALKKVNPRCAVRIVDQVQPDDPAGWGITLPPEALKHLGSDDRHHRLDSFYISYDERRFLSASIDLVGLARQTLIGLLRARCEALDVSFDFGSRFERLTERDLARCDVIVGADGANSVIRESFSKAFTTTLVTSPLYYAWLATPRLFGRDVPTIFRGHNGALFGASAYQYSDSLSTFIVECTARGWQRGGFASADDAQACELIASIFAEDLDGQPVVAGRKLRWRRFVRVTNEHWHYRNAVLLGDAAHTTHFSKGYGTAAAMRDGLCLAKHLASSRDLESAFAAFEHDRLPQMAVAQSRASSSQNWYEQLMHSYETQSADAVLDALSHVERVDDHRPVAVRGAAAL